MRLDIFMNKQIKPLAGENHLLDIIVINNNVHTYEIQKKLNQSEPVEKLHAFLPKSLQN